MARKNRKSSLFERISEVGVFRDTSGGGSSTVAGTPPAAGTQSAIEAASTTGFTAADWFRVRAVDNYPEINQVASVSSPNLTPKYYWHRVAEVGDAIVEQTQAPLGHIEESGVKVTVSADLEEVRSAIRTLSITDLLGHVKPTLEFGVLGFNLENILTALGMLESNAAGAQTQYDTFRAFVNGAAVKEQNDLCWYVNGTRKDGATLIMQAWGCELDYTGLKTNLARGKKAVIPIKITPTSAVRFIEID